VIDTTLATNTPVGAPSTWVLSNHDVTRHVTRYGRVDTSFNALDRQYQYQAPCDLIMGQRRARAAALLLLALPGGMYIYQGEELGLWEVEDIPDELRQDPIWSQSHNLDHGRDGCRVPLPWEGKTPPFGFSPAGSSAAAWLPQPADWLEITIEAQRKDPDSVLELYRTALRIRRTETALGTGDMHWLNSPDRVLAFTREPGFTCVANLTGTAITLPENDGVILRSEQWEGDWLPPDTAVWLRTAQSS